jgi:hypothetical protein
MVDLPELQIVPWEELGPTREEVLEEVVRINPEIVDTVWPARKGSKDPN